MSCVFVCAFWVVECSRSCFVVVCLRVCLLLFFVCPCAFVLSVWLYLFVIFLSHAKIVCVLLRLLLCGFAFVVLSYIKKWLVNATFCFGYIDSECLCVLL